MGIGNQTTNTGDLDNKSYFHPHTENTDFAMKCVSTHLLPIAANSLDNYKYVNKFGQVLSYTTAQVDVNALATPAVYTWLQAAVKLEAISTGTNAADDTNVGAGGTGARTITVQGLDANFDEIEEDISLKGASASDATTKSFLRIHRAFVKTSGTYASTSVGANRGVIVIRTASAGATHIELAIQTGQSLVARYTIPSDWTGYLHHLKLYAQSTKAATFYLNMREGADIVSAPFKAKRIKETFNGIIGDTDRVWDVPLKLSEKSDVWVSTTGFATGSNSSASFDILLVRNAV